MSREAVWHFTQAKVEVFVLNATGGRVSATSDLEYCYVQNGNITGHLEVKRRPVTGRPFKKLVNGQWEYEANFGVMYFNKATELQLETIFNRENRLDIVFTLDNDSGFDPFTPDIDVHTLHIAVADSFVIDGKDNDVIVHNSHFLAEEFE